MQMETCFSGRPLRLLHFHNPRAVLSTPVVETQKRFLGGGGGLTNGTKARLPAPAQRFHAPGAGFPFRKQPSASPTQMAWV